MFIDSGMTVGNILLHEFFPETTDINDLLNELPEGCLPESCRTNEEKIRYLYKTAGLDEQKQRDEIFKIKYIIKLAFKLKLSYRSFENLASTACGYRHERFFPPYYLLHKYLAVKNYDIEAYKRELLDDGNIREFIDNDLINVSEFYEALAQLRDGEYGSGFNSGRRMPLYELKRNIDFQVQGVKHFFETYFV